MTVEAEVADDALTISVTGRLDYQCAPAFRDVWTDMPPSVTRCVLDLHGTDFIDSSGLGMLVDLHRHLGGREIRITRCSPHVSRILRIAHFDRKFLLDG